MKCSGRQPFPICRTISQHPSCILRSCRTVCRTACQTIGSRGNHSPRSRSRRNRSCWMACRTVCRTGLRTAPPSARAVAIHALFTRRNWNGQATARQQVRPFATRQPRFAGNTGKDSVTDLGNRSRPRNRSTVSRLSVIQAIVRRHHRTPRRRIPATVRAASRFR